MDETSEPLLTAEARRTLASVLDEVIPPSPVRGLPGAGELGLASYFEDVLRRQPDLRHVIDSGLAALDDLSQRRSGQGFTALPRTRKLEVLAELESAAPAFLPTLIYNAFTGYYQNPRVLDILGVGPHPPHPEGYEMEPNDLSLLEPVRRRGKMYRE